MSKIRQSLVPVLLLATVAFSSSNVLPVLSINQMETDPLGLDSQEYDNIFNNRYQPRNILNDIFYTISIATSQNNRQNRLPQILYMDIDNNRPDEDTNDLNKHEKYNFDGFRKEQWHNYPRQLDRLNKYLYEHHKSEKRNPDPGDPKDSEDYTEEYISTMNNKQTKAIEDSPVSRDTIAAVTNPFFIFKIRLACLNSKLKNKDMYKYSNLAMSEPEFIPDNKEEDLTENSYDPNERVTKIKRDEISGLPESETTESSMIKNRAVKKRIFSLWSRLQSFNHKGHELQHRRHLHAFYGMPDSDGSGVLTAETRAFVRPPGSPLRWG